MTHWIDWRSAGLAALTCSLIGSVCWGQDAGTDLPTELAETPAVVELAAETETVTGTVVEPSETEGVVESSLAVPVDEQLVGAHAAYESGDYAAALQRYEAVADQLDGGEFHYNLGNLLLRNGDLGRSIAAYRRSALELPRDPDVAANLDFARRSTKDSLEPPTASAVARTLLFWHFRLGRSEALKLFLAVNLLLWLTLAARALRPRWIATRWLAWSLSIVWLALAGSIAWATFLPQRIAVVVPPVVAVRSAPEPAATVRFELHAGAELAVRQQRDGWVEVTLPDAQRGWLEELAVERLDL